MNPIHIAFVDDGISSELFTFNLIQDLEIVGGMVKKNTGKIFRLSHGTTCAAIVQKYHPDFICSSIKILDENGKTNINSLVLALTWCLQYPPTIVNLSIGTVDFRDALVLRPLINALANTSIVVGALSNDSYITYPSSFSSVIGVKRNNTRTVSYIPKRIDGIEFSAPAVHKIISNKREYFFSKDANSYSVPFITSEICKLVSIGTTTAKIRNELIRRYTAEEANNVHAIFPDWINSALIYTDREISHKNLFFAVENMFYLDTKVESLLKEIEKSPADSIVIIDEKGKFIDKTNKLISLAENVEKHIVLFSEKKNSIRSNIRNVNFWSQGLATPVQVKKKSSVVTMPIIVMEDYDDVRLINYSKKIREQFFFDGYNAINCTDWKLGPLYGMNYLSQASPIAASFCDYEKIYKADLVIFSLLKAKSLYTGKKILKSLNIKYDIYINISKGFFLYRAGQKFNKYLFSKNISNEEKIIKNLYLYLVNFLA